MSAAVPTSEAMSSLNPPHEGALRAEVDLAEARAQAYLLFASATGRPSGDELRSLAGLSPRLAEAMGDLSDDELAAQHYHVFGLMAPPLEGLVVDPEARVGNLVTGRILSTLSSHFIADDLPSGAELEHLSEQLALMARACSWEEEALSRGRRDEVEAARAFMAEFLDRHLLQWIFIYEAAVARCARDLPTALMSEVVELLMEHRASLADWSVVEVAPLPVDSRGLDLANPDTDLRDIARALTRPAQCGFMLTRDDLTRIGRAARVPRGFGGRTLELLNLFRSASELGELPGIVAGIESLVEEQEAFVAERLSRGAIDLSSLQRPRQERVARCRAALEELGRAAQETGC